MDSEGRSPAFGETDSTTEQAPNCDGFQKVPCFRSPTLGSTTSLGPDFTVTTPTASLNSLSSLPQTASYSFVGTLTDPPSVTSSPNTVGLETPTAATITSTIAPVYTTETSPSETAPSDSSPHPNTKTTIAIVVPVVVGSVAIIIAIVAFLLWRRRRNSKANKNNRAAPGPEMSREAGPVFLPGNNGDRGQMDVGWSHAAFRESVPPTYQHHNISTPIIQSTTASEVTLMHSPLPPSNVPSPPPPPPPPPRYSTISARERSQMYNDERHSILTIENLAALHGWEGSEDTRGVRDSRDEGAQSPFRDPSDGTSIISPVSDIDSPTARRHGNGDEDSLVSSLGDEHRGSHRMQ